MLHPFHLKLIPAKQIFVLGKFAMTHFFRMEHKSCGELLQISPKFKYMDFMSLGREFYYALFFYTSYIYILVYY